MKPSSCKAKGASFQREVRDAILKAFSILEPDDVRSTSMGASGEDLLLSPTARKLLGGIQIECKHQQTLSIPAWIKQAKEHGKHEPMVVFRRNNEEAYAVIRFDWLLERLNKN